MYCFKFSITLSIFMSQANKLMIPEIVFSFSPPKRIPPLTCSRHGTNLIARPTIYIIV